MINDSQAALIALLSYNQTSKIVQSCYSKLQLLSQYNTLKLIWVPGHSNMIGNKLADGLAREGSSNSLIGPQPFFYTPYSFILNSLNSCKLQNCIEYWNHIPALLESKKTISI